MRIAFYNWITVRDISKKFFSKDNKKIEKTLKISNN